jgi:uncharacterized protein DUF3179
MKAMLSMLMVVFGCAVGVLALGQSDEQLHVVLPRDAIPSIDRPSFELANAKSLNDHEPLIGVVGQHERRAYSIWQLDRHEIVNDTFEGRPIAVTW